MKTLSRSNLLLVAEWRYVQSVHETNDLKNPDTLVRHFLPVFRRWRLFWLGQKKLAILRSDRFYYYLVARTKYYDGVYLDAINNGVKYIVNVGCGTDTRSLRFKKNLMQDDITVLECDQANAISIKKNTVQRLGANNHITYMSIDLNDNVWPKLEQWLIEKKTGKVLVLMEGVSPYVNMETFGLFLTLLASKLQPGSRVAYDFKILGVADNFGRVGRTENPFRLTAETQQVAAYHEKLGYRLDCLEKSCELTTRILQEPAKSGGDLFAEDVLVQLEVT